MNHSEAGRHRFDLAAAAVSAIVFGLFPLTSFDLWWHLASGREIWARHGIPRTDPFSFASDRGPWLDHGWLFQTLLYPLHAAGGSLLLQLVQVLIVFAIAWLGFRELGRSGVSRPVALLTMAIALAVVKPRLALRPELLTLLFLAILLTWLRKERWPVVGVMLMSLIWANVHPGVILGGLVLLVWCVAGWIGRRAILMLVTFSLPLIATPYGIESVLFPFRLRELVMRGGYVNPEWQPATFLNHPLLYLAIATAALLFVTSKSEGRLQRAVVALLLAVFAVQYQRNVGAFGVALPFLVAPELAREWSLNVRRLAAAAAALIAGYSLFTFTRPGLGIDRREIAVDATAFVKQAGVRGRVFNQAKFGGYLIWALYPGEKVLIDGRNEVYTGLLPRLAEAVGDGRKWRRFLDEQRIEWAMIGYNNPPQRVVAGGRAEWRPFGYLHFPPREWALVYWDDTAMVLVRRGRVNQHLEKNAPRYLWPESLAFAESRIRSGEWPRGAVAAELMNAMRQRPDVERAAALAELVR